MRPGAVEPVVEVRVCAVVEVRLDAADPRPLLRLIAQVVLTLDLPVAAPLQEADFRVEVVAHLRVTEPSAPQLVGVRIEQAARIIRSALGFR